MLVFAKKEMRKRQHHHQMGMCKLVWPHGRCSHIWGLKNPGEYIYLRGCILSLRINETEPQWLARALTCDSSCKGLLTYPHNY